MASVTIEEAQAKLKQLIEQLLLSNCSCQHTLGARAGTTADSMAESEELAQRDSGKRFTSKSHGKAAL
jgi:hypothetical protein